MTAAAWTRTARDLTHNLAEAKNYLTIQVLATQTNLSPSTIRDNMARPPIDNDTVPRSAICRPAARIGPTPLWSPSQVVDYHQRAKRRDQQRHAQAAAKSKLPVVGADDPQRAELVTIEQLVGELGCALNTMRRLSRDAEDFPPPVALAARERQGTHGRQHELRRRIPVLVWILRNSVADGARDRVSLSTAHLDELDNFIDLQYADELVGDSTDDELDMTVAELADLIAEGRRVRRLDAVSA
jgi:hypothetical protein